LIQLRHYAANDAQDLSAGPLGNGDLTLQNGSRFHADFKRKMSVVWFPSRSNHDIFLNLDFRHAVPGHAFAPPHNTLSPQEFQVYVHNQQIATMLRNRDYLPNG